MNGAFAVPTAGVFGPTIWVGMARGFVHGLAAEQVLEQVQVAVLAAHLGGQVGDVPAVDWVWRCGHQCAWLAAFVGRTPKPAVCQLSSGLPAIAGIDPALAIRQLGGNAACYPRLLRQFALHYGGLLPSLPGLAGQGDDTALRQMAHSVRGAAGAIGAAALVYTVQQRVRQIHGRRGWRSAAGRNSGDCAVARVAGPTGGSAGGRRLPRRCTVSPCVRAVATAVWRPRRPGGRRAGRL